MHLEFATLVCKHYVWVSVQGYYYLSSTLLMLRRRWKVLAVGPLDLEGGATKRHVHTLQNRDYYHSNLRTLAKYTYNIPVGSQ